MNNALPTGRTGQLAALGLSLLVILLVWTAVIDPALSFFSERAELLASRRAVAARMQALAAQLPDLRKRAPATTEGAQAPVQLGIDGPSEAIATAKLQSTLRDLAAASSIAVESMEALGAKPGPDGRKRVGVTLHGAGSYAALVGLLNTIRQSTPPLSIDDIDIRTISADAAPGSDVETRFTAWAVWGGGR